MDDLHKIKNLLIFLSILLAGSALYFARDLFLPIMIALLVALTFSPVVRALARVGIPEPLSAATLIISAGLALTVGVYMLSGPVSALLEEAPAMGVELRYKLQSVLSSLEEAQNASEQVEGLAKGNDTTQVVAVEQPGLLAFAAGSVANFLGLTGVGLILAMFVLASGDMFYVKLVETFPTFSDKRRAVRTARDIERRVSRYFLTISTINFGLGVSIGLAMYLVGLPNPVLWGALAFMLNFLPFIGAIIGALTVGAFGILSFDTIGAGLLPAVFYLMLTSIEGQIVTPTILGRRLEMNTVSVFLTVIIWSWLWGLPGALMAVPILVILKVICENVPTFSVLANFLGPRTLTEAEQHQSAKS